MNVAEPPTRRLTEYEELSLLLAPTGRDSWTRPMPPERPEDSDAAWAARMAGVCARCGLRKLDESGRCGAYGARKGQS